MRLFTLLSTTQHKKHLFPVGTCFIPKRYKGCQVLTDGSSISQRTIIRTSHVVSRLDKSNDDSRTIPNRSPISIYQISTAASTSHFRNGGRFRSLGVSSARPSLLVDVPILSQHYLKLELSESCDDDGDRTSGVLMLRFALFSCQSRTRTATLNDFTLVPLFLRLAQISADFSQPLNLSLVGCVFKQQALPTAANRNTALILYDL